MSFAAVLLAPLVLLLPAAGAVESRPEAIAPPRDRAGLVAPPAGAAIDWSAIDAGAFRTVAEGLRAQVQNQVRIEQHTTIRIAPRPRPAPVQPNFLVDIPERGAAPRMVERSIGRCLPAAGIGGFQADGSNRLLLFMRDRRIVSAQLERACRSRDFYSGFYVERSADGQLCVDRDTLLSRSGANCKLTRIRQLIPDED